MLLIAAVLPNNDLEYLVAAAKKIGLQSLIEVGCTCTIPPALKLHSTNSLIADLSKSD